MSKDINTLMTPWNIGNVEIKNRIVQVSMGGTSLFGWMEMPHFDKEAAKFHLERAQNNVGLILPGIAHVRNVLPGTWLYKNDKMFRELKDYMEEFHKTDAKLFVQLTGGFGRAMAVTSLMETLHTNPVLRVLSKPILDVGYASAAPSELPNRWSDKVPSRPLTIAEIEELVEAFAKTALKCKEAGVDGVEIHAVHEGYLLDQFTTKYTNFRTDQYGGSMENRYRLACDIVRRIKAVCGDDYPVSLRYSVLSKTKGFRQGAVPGEDYVEVGRDMAESEEAVKLLEAAGYDMLNCDNGTYDAWYWAHPPGYMPENCNLDDVAHIKKFTNLPVVCAGRMTVKDGADAVAENKIDAVGFGRQFLTDPQWVTKMMNDTPEEIMPCISCHNACFNLSKYEGTANLQHLGDTMGMARCALNPMTMQSKKYKIIPTTSKKKVAVIGAGIGGMEAARVLTLRGHHAEIFEKANEVGGAFIAASRPYFKEKDRELIDWYKLQMKNLNVQIHFETEITPTQTLDFDEIIIATGATPRYMKSDKNHVIEACEFLLEKKEAKGDIVIIGGGLTGCEVAYELFNKGIVPTIIEMAPDLMAVPGLCLANSSYLRDFFNYNKVPVYLNTKVKEIQDGKVIVEGTDGTISEIKADTVITSIGFIPNPLRQKEKGVSVIGDAKKVGNLRTVIWDAWDVAMKI
ncbi:MAG: FAD-dependent oxidoreductase [Eubacteriales bacterium]